MEPRINTPLWLDKSFLLVVATVVGTLCAAFFNIHLNAETLAADATLVLGYVTANKYKTGKALVAQIEAAAKARYIVPEEPTPHAPPPPTVG